MTRSPFRGRQAGFDRSPFALNRAALDTPDIGPRLGLQRETEHEELVGKPAQPDGSQYPRQHVEMNLSHLNSVTSAVDARIEGVLPRVAVGSFGSFDPAQG
jgi:hypothetical protein